MDKLNDAVKVVREAAESLKQEPDLPSVKTKLDKSLMAAGDVK